MRCTQLEKLKTKTRRCESRHWRTHYAFGISFSIWVLVSDSWSYNHEEYICCQFKKVQHLILNRYEFSFSSVFLFRKLVYDDIFHQLTSVGYDLTWLKQLLNKWNLNIKFLLIKSTRFSRVISYIWCGIFYTIIALCEILELIWNRSQRI